MKRLAYPVLLIILSLITAAIFTTITAVTFASYAKDENKNTIVIDKKLSSNSEATVQR